jgi:hypothetical protein
VDSVSKIDNADDGPPYIGLSQDQWIDKCVSLMSSEGLAVAKELLEPLNSKTVLIVILSDRKMLVSIFINQIEIHLL